MLGGEGGGVILGNLGLWETRVGFEGSYPLVFDIVPGGTKSLGMLEVRILFIFISLLFGYYLWGYLCCSNVPYPLVIRVPRGIVCLGMLDPARLGMLDLVSRLQYLTLGIRETSLYTFIGSFWSSPWNIFVFDKVGLQGDYLRRY